MRLMTHTGTIRWLAFARWLILALLASALCGCLGGTVAQQLVRSMLLHGADKATAAALDANEAKQKLAAQKMPLKDTTPDKYDIAFVNSSFQEVTAQVEPLPQAPLDEEESMQLMQETKLVQVEVWSMLIGDEKQHILEAAKQQGSSELPPENQWQQSQIAVGATSSDSKSSKQEVITFLIPTEMGKLHSGSKALVEVFTAGQLSVARYNVN